MQTLNIDKTMEDDFLKRNTDCVYFLASPLTCKKGMECEYRHSEMARFNPRSCWYWMHGNCINPTCSFRHPPLDGNTQVSSESAALSCPSSTPATNTSIPCYFYFNGFCYKGERCSYSHGHDDNAIAGKLLKTDALPLDQKTTTENDAGAAPTEAHTNPSKSAPKPSKDVVPQLKEEQQQSAPKIMPLKTISPKLPVFETEEAPLFKSGSLLLNEGITVSSSPICEDESSEEQVDDHVEPEERGQSSPGFDVLVDNKSEDLDYESDSEYLLAPDKEQMEQFLSYEFEDSVQHEARYPNVEFPYDRNVYDVHEDSDNELIPDIVRKPRGHPRDSRLDSTFQKRRRLLPVDPFYELGEPSSDELDLDLRDILSKHRVAEGNPRNFLSRRSEHSHVTGRSSERPQRYGIHRKLRERLASNAGKHSIESMGDRCYFSNGGKHCHRLKHSEPNRSIRRPFQETWLPKQRTISSQVSRNMVSRERELSHPSTAFTGPKTLAEIKEEKRKTEEAGGRMRRSSRTTSVDFQGPKPLSEILKEKGSNDTASNGKKEEGF